MFPGTSAGPKRRPRPVMLRVGNVGSKPDFYNAQGQIIREFLPCPGATFAGTVSRISESVDVATRTMAVELDVNNADNRLAPGTFCQVRWLVRRSTPSLLVPSGSVASTTGRTFVIRVGDGRLEWVDVKTGIATGPLVESMGT